MAGDVACNCRLIVRDQDTREEGVKVSRIEIYPPLPSCVLVCGDGELCLDLYDICRELLRRVVSL